MGGDTEPWTLVSEIRELIKPYLRDRPLRIGELADMLGTSERTLQRRFEEHGIRYKQLVSDARFQVACDLLGDPSIKIIDVAMAAGYENPQHFARAFRVISGLTPREWRNATARAA